MIMTVMTLLIIIIITPAMCWMEGFLEMDILLASLGATYVSLYYVYVLLVLGM